MKRDAFALLMSSAKPKATPSVSKSSSNANVLMVLDFEATCDNGPFYPQELIEFACCAVCLKSKKKLATFSSYVRPTENRTLTQFCRSLTGIRQDQVDTAPLLKDVLLAYDAWLRNHGFLPVPHLPPDDTMETAANADNIEAASSSPSQGVAPFLPVTWTDWDLSVQLHQECKWREIQPPNYLLEWCNIKKLHKQRYGYVLNLTKTLEANGLQFRGRHHSGRADAENTAELALKMLQDGVEFRVTNSFDWQEFEGKDSKKQRHQPPINTPGKVSLSVSQAITGKLPENWDGKCECGLKAAVRVTKKPGANCGRKFYSCGDYSFRRGTGRCQFFQWKDDK